uniref:Putative til domain protein n=1 Tax=Ixodes ricinus TaxID=34613 RepID=A0A0K8R4E8_IXORI
MKIFILVLLVAVLFYVDSAGTTECGANERAVSCPKRNERNVSCHEGTCDSPTPIDSCNECKCYLDDNDGTDCETKCVCVSETLRQADGKCRDPSDCPEGSPGSYIVPYGVEDRK